jgi:hypothetical protein
MLSPAALYFTSTFGYFSLKPSRTAWIDCCSVPTQIPIREIEPEMSSLAPPDVPVPELSLLPPPQAAATSASSAASAK